VSVVHSGSNKKYAAGWEAIFGSKSAAAKPAKKSAKKAAKKSPKKKSGRK